jgi:drug/metabolite transporter (DMT)-like permease
VSRDRARSTAVDAAPAVFVLLWSTGFVGAKYGLPYAEPFTFLGLRLVVAAALLGLAAVVVSRGVPRGMTAAQARAAAVSGLLLHGAYLGGVFWAIGSGTSAGVSAVIVGLQPVLVAALAVRLLGEQLVRRQWLGLGLGLLGVGLVVGPSLADSSGPTGPGVLACLLALLGGTAGTLWQKRHGDGTPLLQGTAVQYAAAAAALGVLSLATESREISWTGEFVGAFVWLVLVLSIGAVLLLLALLRRGTASRVSSLFFLVPPVTAVQAYLLFDERLAAVSVIGVVVTALGVALVVRGGRSTGTSPPAAQPAPGAVHTGPTAGPTGPLGGRAEDP